MEYKYEYQTSEERANIIEENQHLILAAEMNLLEGNFLVFKDTVEKPIVYVTIQEKEFNAIKADNESLNLSVIELYEIITV